MEGIASIVSLLLVCFFACAHCLVRYVEAAPEISIPFSVLIVGGLACVGVVLCIMKVTKTSAKKDAQKRAPIEDNACSEGYALGKVPKRSIPFLKIPEERMQWLEEKVGLVYALFEEGCKPADLRMPLREARMLMKPLEQQDACMREPLDDLHLCRNLIAQDFDPHGAFLLSKKYLEYRAEVNGGVRPPSDWIDQSFVLVPFEDRFGRPVVVVRAKHIDPEMPADLLRDGFRSTLDGVIGHFLRKRTDTASDTNPLEQYIVFLDVEGSGWSNFSTDLVKLMVHEGHNHYPDRLSQIFVLGANVLARAVFGIVSPMVHPRTKRKFQLCSPAQTKTFVRELVGPGKEELLPPSFGGSAKPWVDPQEATTLEQSVGSILADAWRYYDIVPAQHIGRRKRTASSSSLGARRGYGMCCW